MNKEKFVIPPGFFDQLEHFNGIKKYQEYIKTAEDAINRICKKMVPLIKSRCFKKGTFPSMDHLFFLKELKGNTIVESEEDLEFTGNSFFEAVIRKSALRSLTNQKPAATTYHVYLPKEHPFFSINDVELQELIANISKETELSGFSFQFMNRRHAHDLCISAVYHYDKPAE